MNFRKNLSLLLAVFMLMGLFTITVGADGQFGTKVYNLDDGTSYSVSWPKVYGTIKANIMLEDITGESEEPQFTELSLPVVATGEPFVMKFISGVTCSRCPDCDKPLKEIEPSPSYSMANMATYEGPCILPCNCRYSYEINEEYSYYKDVFCVNPHISAELSYEKDTLIIDGEEDAKGLRNLTKFWLVSPDTHFYYTPGHSEYVADGDNYCYWLDYSIDVGFYLRLPKETIDKMDFSKTYNTKELEALIKGEETPKREISIYIENPPSWDLEKRQTYRITNNTDETLNANYALLSYWPKTTWYPAIEEGPSWSAYPEHEYFRGQLLPLKLNLKPGEMLEGFCSSIAVGWPTMTHILIKFDSEAELDSMLSDDALSVWVGSYIEGCDKVYELDMYEKGIEFMKNNFGITIESGKPQ